MRRKKYLVAVVSLLLALVILLCACGKREDKAKIKVLIVPKFEIGQMSGDFPGEAQLFYERYCAGCEELSIPNATPTTHFYLNEDNGVGLLVTGSGKTAAGLSLMSLLSSSAYDFSDTMIVSVGCGGASTGFCTLGDVVLGTAACDYELGHRVDSTELEDPDAEYTWFHDESYDEYSCEVLNSELCEKVYGLVKDCPLRTTEICKRVLAVNFPNEVWATSDPCVKKGTVISADSYWKGKTDHKAANYISEYYECPDKYALTEMEEIAIMNVAECFGMRDRVVSLRVAVNMDVFLEGESPEQLWLDDETYASKVTDDNSETLDIFEPGMENLFDVGRIVIDAILAGEL